MAHTHTDRMDTRMHPLSLMHAYIDTAEEDTQTATKAHTEGY